MKDIVGFIEVSVERKSELINIDHIVRVQSTGDGAIIKLSDGSQVLTDLSYVEVAGLLYTFSYSNNTYNWHP